MPLAHNTNSLLYDYAPQIFERLRKRGDEIVGHGRTNAERQGQMWEDDERRLIETVRDTIAQRTGGRYFRASDGAAPASASTSAAASNAP